MSTASVRTTTAAESVPMSSSPFVPARLRRGLAILLLTVMGLLAAASVLASRPYLPANRPAVRPAPTQGSIPDPC